MYMQKAVFGGGCFWCTEAVFKALEGVVSVKPGYAHSTSSGQAGGTNHHPTYLEVASGKTGFVEVVEVEYNPEKISYRDLLTVFFASHDPTTMNRQGNDVGTQYRSVIFFTTPEQEAEAGEYIKEISGSVTELEPLKQFYEAENYHQDYYANNWEAPYCQIVINPKLDKVKEQFSRLLKSHEK